MLAKTNAVVLSTGGAANVSAASVLKMSDRLEALSMIDQEAILNGQNLLLTFTNIRNGVGQSNHVFDQATTTLVDMATALGSDPQTAAIQLGKALNDPVKGVTALSKVGVSFTKQQKAQIKTLVASGRTMDAQKVILKELNREFGGAAKAAGGGFEGALFRAKDALGDLFRDVATPLLPGFTKKVEELSTFLSGTATPAVLGFVEGFKDKTGAGGKFREDLKDLGEKARDAAGYIKTAFEKTKQIIDFVKAHPDAFKTIAVGVAAYATAMKAAAFYSAAMALAGPRAAVGIAATGTASATAGGAAGVGRLVASLGLLGGPAGAFALAVAGSYAYLEMLKRISESESNVASTRAGLPTATIGPSNGFDSKGQPIPGYKRPAGAPPVTFSKPIPKLAPRSNNSSTTATIGGSSLRQQTTVVIPVQLNGRQVGTAVIDDFEDRVARR